MQRNDHCALAHSCLIRACGKNALEVKSVFMIFYTLFLTFFTPADV